MTELLPCPFCGGQALFEYVRHGGTMSSGMEPPTCYAGCKKCGVRFSGGETQGWDSMRRWYDRLEEAHDQAAAKWNHRHSGGDGEAGCGKCSLSDFFNARACEKCMAVTFNPVHVTNISWMEGYRKGWSSGYQRALYDEDGQRFGFDWDTAREKAARAGERG